MKKKERDRWFCTVLLPLLFLSTSALTACNLFTDIFGGKRIKKLITICLICMLLTAAARFAAASSLILDGQDVTLSGLWNYDQIQLLNGSNIFVAPYDGTSDKGWLEFSASQIYIDSTSSINANYAGFRCHEGLGAGSQGAGSGGGGYGGYGGHGGTDDGVGGTPYGTTAGWDIAKGSGGGPASGYGGGWTGGPGGGSIVLHGDSLSILGFVTANGNRGGDYDWAAGGGSGGGILIDGDDVLISGSLSVGGGDGGNGVWAGGGGGGGRIKIFYDASLDIAGSSIIYSGGSGGSSYINYYYSGEAGQIGTCYIVPEPAMMSLLGIGALSLLRRKRSKA
jgi:hypothetical protein